MARGNEIIVNGEGPKGRFIEGIIDAGITPKPGTAMQIDPSQAMQGGRHVWTLYNRDADGNMPKGPLAILLADNLQGKTATDAYAAGDRCFLYVPLPGDELNLLISNLAGTGDDHTAGEIVMVDDGTGEFIATTGSPEEEVAVLLEDITDPTEDTLAWCYWSR